MIRQLESFLRQLFTLQSTFSNSFERQRAQLLLTINWVLLIGTLGALLYFIVPTQTLIINIGMIAGMVIYFLLTFFAINRRQVQIASYLTMGYSFLIPLVSNTITANLSDPINTITYLFPVVLAGLVLGRVGNIVVLVLLIALNILQASLRVGAELLSFQEALDYSIRLGGGLVAAMSLQIIFSGRREDLTQASVLELEKLRSLLAVTSLNKQNISEQEFANELLRTLRDAFRFDVVQAYMLDDNNRLSRVLRPGLRTLEIADVTPPLTLGDTNGVSETARLGIALQITGADLPKRREHFVSSSVQRGITFPIVDRQRVVGVMDIQTTRDIPLSATEMELLGLVINTSASLMLMLREDALLRRSLSEQEVLTNRMQNQLSLLQAQQQQVVGSSWSEYIDQRGERAVGFDFSLGQIRRAENLPAQLRTALESGDVHVSMEGEEKFVNVPIQLRGETIGAMSFAVPQHYTLTERQIELSKTIAIRLGSALENARLLEQTQAQALRERKATEVANQLLSATDIDSLLRLAADSFNDALGAIQTRIYVEPTVFNFNASLPNTPSRLSNGHSNGNGNGKHDGESHA